MSHRSGKHFLANKKSRSKEIIMNRHTGLRIIAGLVLLAVIAGIAFIAYQAGVTQGVAAELPPDSLPQAYYGPGWHYGGMFSGRSSSCAAWGAVPAVPGFLLWGRATGRCITAGIGATTAPKAAGYVRQFHRKAHEAGERINHKSSP
jgi:hypothetical protein